MPIHQLAATASSCMLLFFLINYEVSLQLSSCRVHVCLSIGYLVRSMLQATVVVILKDINVLVIKEEVYNIQ